MPTLRTKSRDREIHRILHDVFHLDELREGQDEVIHSVLARQNTLAVMPTGSGKSLCYQIPALLLPGTTLIVSPLIALMKDQKEKLDELELEARELNSSVSATDQEQNLKDLRRGKAEFVYVTPERMDDPDFIASMKNADIDLVVIDEAHCVSQWGHDFRPAYLKLKEAFAKIGSPPILALTATATSEVIEDIRQQLGLKQLNVIHTGVMRDNLFYEAFVAENDERKRQLLLEKLQNRRGAAIVYVSTVKLANEIHDYLEENGIRALRYHARLGAKLRSENQDAFMRGDVDVMVATTAFGLGIDKPDIRSVIHFNFPGSLEAYYQESGRAGRDGEPATCTLLYLKKDKSTQAFFLAGKYPQARDIRSVASELIAAGADAKVSENMLQERLEDLSKKKISVVMTALQRAGLIKRDRSAMYSAKKAISEPMIDKIVAEYDAKQVKDENKLRQMIIYAQTALCRWRAIHAYFGEEPSWQQCGHCDNCQKPLSNLSVGALAANHH